MRSRVSRILIASFAAVLIIGFFFGKALAALTLDQLRMHAGAMLFNYIATTLKAGVPIDQVTLPDIVASVENYRINGSTGTVAERTEFAQNFYRQLAARQGLVPAGNAAQVHSYKFHWLRLYVSSTEAAAVEP